MGVVERPRRFEFRRYAPWLFIAALGVALVVMHYWAYITGPSTGDLTDAQRAAVLKGALKRGTLVAMREAGMGTISKAEIASVAKSRCTGAQQCIATRSHRRGPNSCATVEAVLSCAFELVDTKGETAVALVKTTRSKFHRIPDFTDSEPEWLADFLQLQRPDQLEAKATFCRMGYCAPGALARWKPPPRVVAPDPHAEARRQCAGVFAEVVGRGMTCLLPTDPASREFRDCNGGVCGPAMVALPTGSYVRGTSQADIEALKQAFPDFSYLGRDEHPEREVTIAHHVAVSVHEVSYEQWDACRRDGACKPDSGREEPGFPNWKGPVVHVSWDDITRDYLPWLNAKLGLASATSYRLPSDGEWEYAARAGTTTRYAFGDTITPADARFFPGPLGAPVEPPAEMGSFRANAFGLHDMHGNVAEWVADCFGFLSGLSDLPLDGSALMKTTFGSTDCTDRAFRGGSFVSFASGVRSAVRSNAKSETRHRTLGFRLARTLAAKP